MDYTFSSFITALGMTIVPQMDPNWDYQPGQAGIIGKDHLVLCLTEVMK